MVESLCPQYHNRSYYTWFLRCGLLWRKASYEYIMYFHKHHLHLYNLNIVFHVYHMYFVCHIFVRTNTSLVLSTRKMHTHHIDLIFCFPPLSSVSYWLINIGWNSKRFIANDPFYSTMSMWLITAAGLPILRNLRSRAQGIHHGFTGRRNDRLYSAGQLTYTVRVT